MSAHADQNPENRASISPGTRLRALRAERKLTLSDLHKLSGITVSTLSKIETGRVSLTYGNMMKLAGALDIDPSVFLSTSTPPVAQRHKGRKSVSRAGQGLNVGSGVYDYVHLASELRDKAFMPMMGEVTARSLDDYGELLRHEGEEFHYVLCGSLEFHTTSYAPVVLSAGQYVYFDSAMGHAYVALTQPCRILSVCATGRRSDSDFVVESSGAVRQLPTALAGLRLAGT
jgi:transcriptional regulator with XRE-family HTH domain